MTLEQIIAVENRGSGLRPCIDECADDGLCSKLLPKNCRSLLLAKTKNYEAHIILSLAASERAYELNVKIRHMSIDVYGRYLLYNISHQSALELAVVFPTSSPPQNIIPTLFLPSFKGYRKETLHRHVMKQNAA